MDTPTLHASDKMIRSQLLKTFAACGVLMAFAGCASTRQDIKPQPLATAPVQERETTAEEHQFAAVQALKVNDLSKAKSEFASALAKNHKLLIANYDLGFILQSEGNLEAAEKHYRAVLEVEPGHEATILNLGKVYRDRQRYGDGAALFEKALEGRPFDVNYLNNLAVFYRLAKKHDEATETVRKLLSRTRDNPDAYKNLALIAYDQDQLRLAEFIGGNAKKLDEKDPGVYNNLGLVYMKLGERRLALKQFKKAVSLEPDFAAGHANIGAMALSYRDYETAAASFEKVVKLEPTNAIAHLNLAWSYEGVRLKDGTHRSSDAATEFEKVLALVNEHPDALYGLSRAYAGELKDLQKAKGFLERYLGVASGEAKQKATKELQVLEQRILAGAQAERMKREAEENRKRAEEEKRRKATDAQPGDSSILDRVSEKAAAEAEQENAIQAGAGGERQGESPLQPESAAPAPAEGAAPPAPQTGGSKL